MATEATISESNQRLIEAGEPTVLVNMFSGVVAKFALDRGIEHKLTKRTIDRHVQTINGVVDKLLTIGSLVAIQERTAIDLSVDVPVENTPGFKDARVPPSAFADLASLEIGTGRLHPMSTDDAVNTLMNCVLFALYLETTDLDVEGDFNGTKKLLEAYVERNPIPLEPEEKYVSAVSNSITTILIIAKESLKREDTIALVKLFFKFVLSVGYTLGYMTYAKGAGIVNSKVAPKVGEPQIKYKSIEYDHTDVLAVIETRLYHDREIMAILARFSYALHTEIKHSLASFAYAKAIEAKPVTKKTTKAAVPSVGALPAQ